MKMYEENLSKMEEKMKKKELNRLLYVKDKSFVNFCAIKKLC